MIDNAEWLLALNYVDFLREVGRHISVNQMIQRESVKLRLEREHHLSFLEFNYMVLQAYDFVELFRRYGCRLQLGGSDQWGNIVSGIDLGRKLQDVELFAVTSPLITTSSGAKMGKTAAGAVWLNAEMVSPYEYWQFWRNTEDADVGRFLKLFTELPLDEIARLDGARRRRDQRGQEGARHRGDRPPPRPRRGRRGRRRGAQDLRGRRPRRRAADDHGPPSELDQGIAVTALFVRAGLVASNGEVRRAIANNAISVNDVRITDPLTVITAAHFNADGVSKLSLGRKKHVLAKQA